MSRPNVRTPRVRRWGAVLVVLVVTSGSALYGLPANADPAGASSAADVSAAKAHADSKAVELGQ